MQQLKTTTAALGGIGITVTMLDGVHKERLRCITQFAAMLREKSLPPESS